MKKKNFDTLANVLLALNTFYTIPIFLSEALKGAFLDNEELIFTTE